MCFFPFSVQFPYLSIASYLVCAGAQTGANDLTKLAYPSPCTGPFLPGAGTQGCIRKLPECRIGASAHVQTTIVLASSFTNIYSLHLINTDLPSFSRAGIAEPF